MKEREREKDSADQQDEQAFRWREDGGKNVTSIRRTDRQTNNSQGNVREERECVSVHACMQQQ